MVYCAVLWWLIGEASQLLGGEAGFRRMREGAANRNKNAISDFGEFVAADAFTIETSHLRSVCFPHERCVPSWQTRHSDALGMRDALADAPMQILQSGVGGGFVGDRQFEGSSHLKNWRFVQFAMRSANPLVKSFNYTLLHDMLQDYCGRLAPVPPPSSKAGSYM